VSPPSAAPRDPAFADVDWTGATSAYGPLFTLASYPLAWLPVGVAVAVLKALAAAAALGIALLVARLAPARGVDPVRAAAFVALNPLVLVHVVGGAHNDGLAMLLAMLGVAAVLAGREPASGGAFAAALAIKAPAAFAAPFALIASRRPPRFLAGAFAALALAVLAAWAAFGWDWLGAFGLAGENQGRTSHMSVPITFARLTGVGPEVTRVGALSIYGALLVYLLVWTWRSGDWVASLRLGGHRPAARHSLALALVPDLGAAARRPLPRPPPPAPRPRPDRVSAGDAHPALTRGRAGSVSPG
jgi:hypothetical protein